MSPTVTLARRPATTPPPDLAGSAAEGLVLVVAPCNGRFRPIAGSGAVAAGSPVAQLTTGRNGTADVVCPVGIELQGLLTRPGQLVTQGQALAWARVSPRGA